jgi:hypothetical protein
MPSHDCRVPGGLSDAQKRWKCPICKRVWTFNKNAGTGADLWHGRDNVRKANGSKPKGGFWAWLMD